MRQLYGGIDCVYRVIFHVDDFKYSSNLWSTLIDNQTKILDEVFEVKCHAKLVDSRFNKLYVNFINKFKHSKVKKKNFQCEQLDIILLSYDSGNFFDIFYCLYCFIDCHRFSFEIFLASATT